MTTPQLQSPPYEYNGTLTQWSHDTLEASLLAAYERRMSTPGKRTVNLPMASIFEMEDLGHHERRAYAADIKSNRNHWEKELNQILKAEGSKYVVRLTADTPSIRYTRMMMRDTTYTGEEDIDILDI